MAKIWSVSKSKHVKGRLGKIPSEERNKGFNFVDINVFGN